MARAMICGTNFCNISVVAIMFSPNRENPPQGASFFSFSILFFNLFRFFAPLLFGLGRYASTTSVIVFKISGTFLSLSFMRSRPSKLPWMLVTHRRGNTLLPSQRYFVMNPNFLMFRLHRHSTSLRGQRQVGFRSHRQPASVRADCGRGLS